MTRVWRIANSLAFDCPGCGDTHTIPIAGEVTWTWNGSLELPTFTPSLRVRSGHYAPHWKPGDGCWCGHDYGFTCYECHSVITDGRIAFCADSSHALAGQTVDMPDVGDRKE